MLTTLKLNRAFSIVGITMPSVRAHIERNMRQFSAALADLTSRELAAVAALHNSAFHEGRAAAGAECLDGTPEDGLYWLGGEDGVAITMRDRQPERSYRADHGD